MKQRFITAFVLIGICVPCLLYGGFLLSALCIALVCGAIYEALRIHQRPVKMLTKVIIYALGIGGAVVAQANIREYIGMYCAAALLIMMSLSVFDGDFKVDQMALVYLLLMALVITSFVLFELHKKDNGVFEIMLLMFGTYLTDAMALFCGMAFGKHKLCPSISPKKTIEGAVGGYLCCVTVLLIYVKLTSLSFDTFNTLCCFILPFTGQIGDLAFSVIKRFAGIKDFGNIFPGHGGVFDRIDSLIFNCFVVYILLGLI